MATSVLSDGAEIYYEDHGEGLPLVFVHGGGGFDLTYLRNAFIPLAEVPLRLVFFDWRGNGRSSRREADLKFTIESLAQDIDELRESLGISEMVLYGHSIGGILAQEYAVRFPKRPKGLILDSTFPSFGQEMFASLERRASPEQFRALADAFGSSVPDDESLGSGMKQILPIYFYEFSQEKGEAFVSEIRFSAVAFNRMAQLIPGIDTTESLGHIETPTLVIAGRHDLYGLAEVGERMCTRIPHCRLAVFEKSGHFPFIEEPEEYFRTVTDFVSALPERSLVAPKDT